MFLVVHNWYACGFLHRLPVLKKIHPRGTFMVSLCRLIVLKNPTSIRKFVHHTEEIRENYMVSVLISAGDDQKRHPKSELVQI